VPRRRGDARWSGKSSHYTYNAERKVPSTASTATVPTQRHSTIINNVWHWTSFDGMPDGTTIIRYNDAGLHKGTYVWQWSKNKGAWHPGGTGSGKKK
jgi:hypothetical protein